LGGLHPLLTHLTHLLNVLFSDPRWANPIKKLVRQTNEAKAVNEVVNHLKPSKQSMPGESPLLLRVMNGISNTTSSIITTDAHENMPVSIADGLPGQPGNSTIRWGGGLTMHLEHDHEDSLTDGDLSQTLPPPRKEIIPSLATLEKAVSAKIYFENLYYPLLRQAPSREQRRVAMEQDMANMGLSDAQKERLRARWRRNETEYLRRQRQKVDVTAFVKLKTIGHGWCPALS
jgi:protein-serine/threonine kinase